MTTSSQLQKRSLTARTQPSPESQRIIHQQRAIESSSGDSLLLYTHYDGSRKLLVGIRIRTFVWGWSKDARDHEPRSLGVHPLAC